MSNVTSRKYKELESRLEDIEKWLTEKNEDLTRLDMLSNYSFLIKAVKELNSTIDSLTARIEALENK